MRKKWLFSVFVLMVLISLTMTGCNFSGSKTTTSSSETSAPKESNAPEAKPQQGGDKAIRLYFNSEVKDLNQLSASDTIAFTVLNNVSEGLYRLDDKHEPQPALASGVETSADGLTYTFTLRDGVKWSNDNPITAADFKYSWLAAMHPDSATSGYAFILSDYIQGADEYAKGGKSADSVGIEAKDARTLVVKLKQPTPYFLRLTAFIPYFPLNEEFVKQKGKDYALKPDNLLYAGPYVMSEFDPAAGVVLSKNSNYWDANSVKVDKISFKVIKEQNTALNTYKAGQLDRVLLASSDVDTYKSDKEFGTSIEFRTTYLQFNTSAEGLSNLNIRKALELAYDAKILEDVILKDGSKAATGMIPFLMSGVDGKAFRDLQGDLVKQDVAKAKEFWDKGVKELGSVPKLSLLIGDDSITKDTATFLQSEYKKNLGIDIVIDTKTIKARNQLMDDNQYQMGITAWGADYNDAMTFLDLWTNHTPYRGSYTNAEYDGLIADAKKEANANKRIEKLLQAEKILLVDDTVVSPLYHRGNAFLQKGNVKGLIYHPDGPPVEFKTATVE